MHQAAYRALGEDWRYQLLPVPPHLLAETVAALPAAGFHGVNVTIPHKEAALALADAATDAAREIGAANTLTFSGGRVEAANTDAPGPAGRPSGAGERHARGGAGRRGQRSGRGVGAAIGRR